MIVANLNNLERPKFRVVVRAVRDRFFKLIEKFKKNEKEETRASGIQGAEFDELYRGLTDINQRMEEARISWEVTMQKEKRKQGKSIGHEKESNREFMRDTKAKGNGKGRKHSYKKAKV